MQLSPPQDVFISVDPLLLLSSKALSDPSCSRVSSSPLDSSHPWRVGQSLREMYQRRQQRVVPEVHVPDLEHHLTKDELKALPCQHSLSRPRRKTPRSSDVSTDHSVPEVGVSEYPSLASRPTPQVSSNHMLSTEDVELTVGVSPSGLPPSLQHPTPPLPGNSEGRRPSAGQHLRPRIPVAPLDVASLADAQDAEVGRVAGHGAEVEITLTSIRGYSQGVSDVIGTLDWDRDGSHLATGGIARKIRVYSMAHLRAKQEEMRSTSEGKRCRSEEEDSETEKDDDEEDDEVSSDFGSDWRRSSRLKRRNISHDFSVPGAQTPVPFFMRCGHGGLRRKPKASSTNNLEALCQSREREHVLDSDACASSILCTAAKLSCVQWSPWGQGVVGCGDYDGVFCEWDVESGMCVSERDEHQGQKVWSIKYCQSPAVTLAATASEDGTVKLWSAGSESCVRTLKPGLSSALCSVDFSEDGRFLVTGGADSHVYMYDLRQSTTPLAVMQGHERTVSYTRFMGQGAVVSAAIDSTVKVWDVQAAVEHLAGALDRPRRHSAVATASEHVNRRNFTGLAVRASDGLVLAGSEQNELVGYRYQAGKLSRTLCLSYSTGQLLDAPSADLMSPSITKKPFVSAMNWQGSGSSRLGVANSEGMIRIINVS